MIYYTKHESANRVQFNQTETNDEPGALTTETWSPPTEDRLSTRHIGRPPTRGSCECHRGRLDACSRRIPSCLERLREARGSIVRHRSLKRPPIWSRRFPLIMILTTRSSTSSRTRSTGGQSVPPNDGMLRPVTRVGPTSTSTILDVLEEDTWFEAAMFSRRS